MSNPERPVQDIHQIREEILGLSFEELEALTDPTEGDWTELSRVYSVVFTWAADATRFDPRLCRFLVAGRTVQEILANMGKASAATLQEAINAAAVPFSGDKPPARRPWKRKRSRTGRSGF